MNEAQYVSCPGRERVVYILPEEEISTPNPDQCYWETANNDPENHSKDLLTDDFGTVCSLCHAKVADEDGEGHGAYINIESAISGIPVVAGYGAPVVFLDAVFGATLEERQQRAHEYANNMVKNVPATLKLMTEGLPDDLKEGCHEEILKAMPAFTHEMFYDIAMKGFGSGFNSAAAQPIVNETE